MDAVQLIRPTSVIMSCSRVGRPITMGYINNIMAVITCSSQTCPFSRNKNNIETILSGAGCAQRDLMEKLGEHRDKQRRR